MVVFKLLAIAVLVSSVELASCQEITTENEFSLKLLSLKINYTYSHFAEAKTSLPHFSTYSLSAMLPNRLPLFCALEKKLSDASKMWIKIRLPEKRLLHETY